MNTIILIWEYVNEQYCKARTYITEKLVFLKEAGKSGKVWSYPSERLVSTFSFLQICSEEFADQTVQIFDWLRVFYNNIRVYNSRTSIFKKTSIIS